jgi:superfamily II DNA or RNA helicase
MQVIIDNRIRIPTKDCPKKLLSEIKKEFRHNNPAYFKAKAMGYATYKIPRIIATFDLEDNGDTLTLPRGGLARFEEACIRHGVKPVFLSKSLIRPVSGVSWDPAVTLRPYQENAVTAILEAHTCLIEAAPAAGKTEILIAAAARAGQRFGIIVPTKEIFSQWVSRIEVRLGIPKRKIGKVGGGQFRIGEVATVMMQQTARNKADLLYDQFGFVGLDECHHVADNTFLKLLDRFTAKYRVGVTATIKRQDLKHFLMYDLFGPVAFSIGREELVDLGFTTDIRLHIVPTDFEYDYMNEEALRSHLAEDEWTDYEDLSTADKKRLEKKLDIPRKNYPEYLDECLEDKDRNNLIFRHVKPLYKQGKIIVLFTKRRNHCEMWQDAMKKQGIECAIFWGTQKKSEKLRIKRDLKRIKQKEIQVAIGTTIDEGIDMPAVDVGMITYRNAGNVGNLEQQAGRLARLFEGKDFGELYYFHDHKIARFKGDANKLKKQFKNTVIHAKIQKRKGKEG